METTDIVFRNASGVPVTTSFLVAEAFGKKHKNVLRDIDNLECSEDFQGLNFEPLVKIRELPNGCHKQERYFTLTKDGFTFLAMGYTGKKAAEFKEKYIAAFNAMERRLQQGFLPTEQFMTTQMQMMQQVIGLCDTLMQRLDTLAPATTNKTKPEHRHPAIHPNLAAQQQAEEEDKWANFRNGNYHTIHIPEEDMPKRCTTGGPVPPPPPSLPKRPGVLIGYTRLRNHYGNWMTVSDSARELRRRGVEVTVHHLYDFLRTNGYIHSTDEWYNCPTDESVRQGYMVGVTCGDRYGTDGHRTYHTPYLNPVFVDSLFRLLKGEQATIVFTEENPQP